MSESLIPVVLFAYARPSHLARVLACLKENRVPLILAYSDGSKTEADEARVTEVRAMLRAVDWCEIRLIERERNFGLGKNVISGVTDAADSHEAFIVWEDDLVCVAGTYDWICSALRAYANDPQVMSVAGWTHPRLTPCNLDGNAYFDGRACCWGWGTWARAWRGMERETALEKMRAAQARGIAPHAYGADLPEQAGYEGQKNIWAVRLAYHHLQYGGLCLRPPWSMVEHIGFDALATNANCEMGWANPPLREAPLMSGIWPPATEHADCRRLWRQADPSAWRRVFVKMRSQAGRAWTRLKG